MSLNNPKPDHKPHGDPHGGSNHPSGRPYWQRAHHDWRFWVAVILMLLAIIIYVLSDDLGGWTNRQPRQPISL